MRGLLERVVFSRQIETHRTNSLRGISAKWKYRSSFDGTSVEHNPSIGDARRSVRVILLESHYDVNNAPLARYLLSFCITYDCNRPRASESLMEIRFGKEILFLLKVNSHEKINRLCHEHKVSRFTSEK